VFVCKRIQQQLIDEARTNGDAKAQHVRVRHRAKNGDSTLSGEPRRERIMEKGICEFVLVCAAGRNHQCRVADVGDLPIDFGHRATHDRCGDRA
jgi:hypothetical protein